MKRIIFSLFIGLFLFIADAGAAYIYFYDDSDNSVNPDAENNNNNWSMTTDGACAYSNLSGSTSLFDCNGKCTKSISGKTNKITITPNGSYFTSSDGANYFCNVDGRWIKCESAPGDDNAFANSPTLRKYCLNGYRDVDLNIPVTYSSNFCEDPYDFHNDFNNIPGSSYLNCTYLTNNNNTNMYKYTGCRTGYYLGAVTYYQSEGTDCLKCPLVANGTNTTPDMNTATSCTLTCNNGYSISANGKACEASTCPNTQYDPTNYSGAVGCKTCPANAKCNGGYVYCPVSYYVDASVNGTAKCTLCPDSGLVYAGYTDSLTNCTGDGYAWGTGIATNCMWTNDTNSDATNCVKYKGTNASGSYSYVTPSNEPEQCWYSN